nr:MAG TPA: hypothetical protein [Caudoviricetes sp.]
MSCFAEYKYNREKRKKRKTLLRQKKAPERVRQNAQERIKKGNPLGLPFVDLCVILLLRTQPC